MNKKQFDGEIGISSSDMTIGELKTLCKDLKLNTKGLTSKADFLKVVQEWEKTQLEASEKQDEEISESPLQKEKEEKTLEFHEGRLVVSKAKKSINNVDYIEITTDNGLTYLVRE